MKEFSLLHEKRLAYLPHLPRLLRALSQLSLVKEPLHAKKGEIASLFPHTWGQPLLKWKHVKHESIIKKALRLGVVFSGGQASGGHNVIAGIFDALQEIHPESALFGFLGGPSGIIEGKSVVITRELLHPFRNQGGFDLIGSGRTKIETKEQMQASLQACKNLSLQGLIIIGGDDSNTNAALLAEYFAEKKAGISVIGSPKTIDGDLKNEHIEISFGFDTACKIYSELIGNIARDALSAKKYYHFIRLMGRSASHIALECALATRPNLAVIGEEIAKEKKTLPQIVGEIADLIVERSSLKKDYGVILVPEGIIEFIPEIKLLLKELNALLIETSPQKIEERLTPACREVFLFLPKSMQEQLLFDRDPHGNVQVSKIETEKLLAYLVDLELKKRKEKGLYKGKFSTVEHFLGYEGRCGMPSNFDAQYCYALGFTAALLVREGANGYMACVGGLHNPPEGWEPKGAPLAAMFAFEKRQGKDKPVIKKALVDLEGKAFAYFQAMRGRARLDDHYLYPGPIQFAGDPLLTETVPFTLQI